MTMNMHSKIVARFVGIALITAAFAVPKAFAADPADSVRTQTVKFDDLSVGVQAGAVTLYQRIHQAAKQVCAQPGADSKNLRVLEIQQSCIARAESRAVDDVHSGALSAYYQTIHGSSYAMTASNNVK
jgi:UrcA family protein